MKYFLAVCLLIMCPSFAKAQEAAKPNEAETALHNSLWDGAHPPHFITQNLTWTVCSSGCTYTNPLSAWSAALSANIENGAVITIQIADGHYALNNQLFTDTTKTKSVHVIGNLSDPSRVVLTFTNTKGTNLGGFSAYNGGQIGFIDGMTLNAPTDGSGALSSVDSQGRNLWNAQSYGSGVQAYGAGSNIKLGSHMVVHGFYYSLVADNNGGIDAPNGGVAMSLAGDVNAMARGGGVIVCTPCTASNASDYTNPSVVVLGSNYDAERGGSLYIDGSTGSGSFINGLVGLTGGHIWAHNMTFSGGLNGGGTGVWITGNSSAELTGSQISGYYTGILAQSGGIAFPDSTKIQNCTYGIVADNGRISGANVTITGSKTVAIDALHTGSIILFNTMAHLSHNAATIWTDSSGKSRNGSSWMGSSANIQ